MNARWGLLGAVLALVAGCGLPSDKHADPIRAADVPFGLAETTTTSTTTTTLPPATTTTVARTTTTIPTEAVTVWFVLNNKLQPVVRQLPKPVDNAHILNQLATVAEQPAGLRTAVPAGAVLKVGVNGGVATADLAPGFAINVPTQDQALAFGQMVLTLTSRPGVGQVRFTTGGKPQQILLPDGTLQPGPLSADVYKSLRNR